MRRLRADVSHRIRRRGPPFLRATWLRILIAGSVMAILTGALVLSLWSSYGGSKRSAKAPGRQEPTQVSVATSSTPSSTRLATIAPPGKTAPPAALPKAAALAPTSPPPVFRVQVGAFADHRNADRVVERLRQEGFGPATSVSEQERVLYRVLAAWPEGAGKDPSGATDDLAERVRAVGLAPELTEEGLAATGLVPLPAAEEASRRLREHGIPVRLREEVGSATFRVVRVGSYATSEEAERTLAALVARGFGGLVVRER